MPLKKPEKKVIGVRVPEDIREWLDLQAGENGRSLSGEIVYRLKRQMKEEAGGREAAA